MSIKNIKKTIAEYGFLAEPYVVMSSSDALALTDRDGVPSFERLVNCAKQKSALADEAWAPAERATEKRARRQLSGISLSRSVTVAFALLFVVAALFMITPGGKALAESVVRSVGRLCSSILLPNEWKAPGSATTAPTEVYATPIDDRGSDKTEGAAAAIPKTPAPSAAPAHTAQAASSPAAIDTPAASAAPTQTPEPQPTATPQPHYDHVCAEPGCFDGSVNGCSCCMNEGGLHICAANFPDAVFRNYISNTFDNDCDGSLSTGELALVRSISVDGMGVGKVTVEYFEELESLSCSHNTLYGVQVSHNKKLKYLDCSYTDNNGLDLCGLKWLLEVNCSGNPTMAYLKLENTGRIYRLDCSGCMLNQLDTANNCISWLDCSHNHISTLVTQYGFLSYLDVSYNRLAYLDIEQGFMTCVLSPQDIGGVVAQADEAGCSVPLENTGWLIGRYARITEVYGITEDGQSVPADWDPSSGVARFDFIPYKLRYAYNTGCGIMLVDLRVYIIGD